MIELVNGCLRCKHDYDVNEFEDNGRPAHVHYCNECVKRCSKCKIWLVITHFLPVLDHPAYQDWLRSKTSEHDDPLGLLLGRDVVDDLCLTCKPFRQPVAPARVHPSPLVVAPAEIVEEEEDDLSRLEALLARRRQSRG